MLPFQKFDKIPRLKRGCTIAEKIDGTNAQIYITDFTTIHNAFAGDYQNQDQYADECISKYALYTNKEGHIFAGSRKRWLDTSSDGDNYGFAKWVQANAEELLKLGEGRHYGEWYGKGIQRGYGLDEKRFALFNTGRWANKKYTVIENDKQQYAPKCCEVVPVLYRGDFDTAKIQIQLDLLKNCGSSAVPGFMNPEGIVIYHTASGKLFKQTIKNDESPKGKE